MDVDFLRWKREYRTYSTTNVDAWMRHCREEPSLADAVMAAALARDLHGRKNPHQHRLPDGVLRRMGERLLEEIGALTRCRDFDELYRLVSACRVKGVGELTIYDTALRIGWRLGLTPDKVYLHAGTRIGADTIGLGHAHPDFIEREELPEEWRDLEPYEVEDILCIYKDRFLDPDAPAERFFANGFPRGRFVDSPG